MSHAGNRFFTGADPKALKGLSVVLLFLDVFGSMGDPMELDRPWSPRVFLGISLPGPLGWALLNRAFSPQETTCPKPCLFEATPDLFRPTRASPLGGLETGLQPLKTDLFLHSLNWAEWLRFFSATQL